MAESTRPALTASDFRTAAGRIRELASAATPGPYVARTEVDDLAALGLAVSEHQVQAGTAVIIGTLDAPTAAHVAAWPPSVALSVADWLEQTAERHQRTLTPGDCYQCIGEAWPCRDWAAAERVVRVFLEAQGR